MRKLGMAVGLCWLAGCGGAIGSAPQVERFAEHQGTLWPAGKSGSTGVYESASGFLAYGVAGDGTIVFLMSGTPDELPSFHRKARSETGIPAERCQPSPTAESPIPCPPGPTGEGGHTQQ